MTWRSGAVALAFGGLTMSAVACSSGDDVTSASAEVATPSASAELDQATSVEDPVEADDEPSTIASPITTPTSSAESVERGSGLDADQRRRVDQLISAFENSTTEIQYDYAENIDDGRGVTAGRAGFTTAT